MATSNRPALRDQARQGNQPGSQVATREQQQESNRAELTRRVREMVPQFAMAMPKGMEAEQLARDAVTLLRQNPALAECEPVSFLGSLMTAAQLGLRPGVLGHSYVLPFWDNKAKCKKAQLVIGYQGLVDLAHRTGKVASIIARTVRAADTFDVDYGVLDTIVHKPNLTVADRGEPVAYYAIVKFTNGGHAFYVMSHAEMERYRDKYATAKTREGVVFGPWRDEFEGMAHKTCVRQLAKWMPKSTELAAALAHDGAVRSDLTPEGINAPRYPELPDSPPSRGPEQPPTGREETPPAAADGDDQWAGMETVPGPGQAGPADADQATGEIHDAEVVEDVDPAKPHRFQWDNATGGETCRACRKPEDDPIHPVAKAAPVDDGGWQK